MSKEKIIAGAKVHYTSPHGSKENGIVKSFNDSKTTAWVVYHCNEDWSNYMDYTGAATNIEDLSFGWVNENGVVLKEFCDHYYIHTNAKWRPINERQCQWCGDVID